MSASITKTAAADRLSTVLWVSAVVYTILLSVASLLPSAGQDSGGWDSALSSNVQNVLHVPAYVFLVLLWLEVVQRSWRLHPAGAAAIVAACVFLGAAFEWIQATAIPGRMGSWSDGLWNTVGAAGGYAAWLLYRNMRRPIHR